MRVFAYPIFFAVRSITQSRRQNRFWFHFQSVQRILTKPFLYIFFYYILKLNKRLGWACKAPQTNEQRQWACFSLMKTWLNHKRKNKQCALRFRNLMKRLDWPHKRTNKGSAYRFLILMKRLDWTCITLTNERTKALRISLFTFRNLHCMRHTWPLFAHCLG